MTKNELHDVLMSIPESAGPLALEDLLWQIYQDSQELEATGTRRGPYGALAHIRSAIEHFVDEVLDK